MLNTEINKLIIRTIKENGTYKKLINDDTFKVLINGIFIKDVIGYCVCKNIGLTNNRILSKINAIYETRIIIPSTTKLCAVDIKDIPRFQKFLNDNGFRWMTGGIVNNLHNFGKDDDGKTSILLNNGRIQFSSNIKGTMEKNPTFIYGDEEEIIKRFNEIKENEIKFQNELFKSLCAQKNSY